MRRTGEEEKSRRGEEEKRRRGVAGRGVDSTRTKQKPVAREQRNRYTRGGQEQHLPIGHTGRPPDLHIDSW